MRSAITQAINMLERTEREHCSEVSDVAHHSAHIRIIPSRSLDLLNQREAVRGQREALISGTSQSLSNRHSFSQFRVLDPMEAAMTSQLQRTLVVAYYKAPYHSPTGLTNGSVHIHTDLTDWWRNPLRSRGGMTPFSRRGFEAELHNVVDVHQNLASMPRWLETILAISNIIPSIPHMPT
jgi:hypothetical protein